MTYTSLYLYKPFMRIFTTALDLVETLWPTA
jgi:hypothetical protein